MPYRGVALAMSSEGQTTRLGDRLDDINDRFDEFETELDEAIDSGRTQLRELTADLRARFEALRGQEPEPEPDRLETLRADLEELSTTVESEIDEGRHRLAEILADLREQVHELERTIRDS